MIEDEIKLYDEPPPYTSTNTYTYQKKETPEEKAEWEAKCKEQLEKAKQLFKINDCIATKNNKTNLMIIIEFVENIEDMQRFGNNPCVLKARNPKYHGPPIQYSIDELDMESHIKSEDVVITEDK